MVSDSPARRSPSPLRSPRRGRLPRPRTPACSSVGHRLRRPELTQPFKPWLDDSYYKLVDGGSFEDGAEAGRSPAARASSTATPPSASAGRDWSLLLPAGSTATSAAGLRRPRRADPALLRRRHGPAPDATVSVQFQLDSPASWVTLPVGVDLGAAWQPCLPSPGRREPTCRCCRRTSTPRCASCSRRCSARLADRRRVRRSAEPCVTRNRPGG